MSTGYTKWSAGPLVSLEQSDQLDLTNLIGQRQATFRFELINGVTSMRLGQLQPVRDAPAVLTHDITSTTKRQLSLALDHVDLAEINPLTDRILPVMELAGQDWPLGRYMWVTDPQLVRTGGNDGSPTLTDEMTLVDQEITDAFAASGSCDAAMFKLVKDLPLVGVRFAASPYAALGAWLPGSRRGQMLEALAAIGDLESPWFSNTGVLTSVRVIDPAQAVPDFDFDIGTPVYMDSIMLSNDLLSAPNRFVVIGNGGVSSVAPLVGVYDVPPSAPHSIASRGFVIQQTQTLQLLTSAQATAAARRWGLRTTPVQEVTFTTPPDPRHDGYQVGRFLDANWLEVRWSMTMIEGGSMTHTMRRAYTP